MEPSKSRYRWVMLGLIWLLYLVFGIITRSLSPLVTPIIKELKISFVQMGLILGSWQLTYIVFAAVDGAIIDRWGIRKSLLAGVIVLALSETLRYFANGFIPLLLCVALIGVGGPMISIGSPKAISQWFNTKERGFAAGIYMTASTVGSLIAFSTANSIVMPLTGYSWRLTFAVYGAFALVAIVIWFLFARDFTEIETRGKAGIFQTFSALIRIPTVRLMLLMGLLSFMVSHGFSNWLPQILEARGTAPAAAGLISSIPLLVSLPAFLIIPRIVPPQARSYVIAAMYLVCALSLFLVSSDTTTGLYSGLVLFGLVSMPVQPLLMLILMESPEIGSKYMGSAAGLFFCVAEVGGFSGPLLLGTIRNATGNFLIGTLIVAGLSVVTGIMGFFLKSKNVPED